ncbi:MAG: hypothetical protein JW932_15550, partial [Deltaproteobacteria bacterium]|nr:hypothetical protein [Deltaproteobacteria bacterium]
LDGKIDAIGGYLDTEIAAILEDTGTTLDGKLDAIDSLIDALLARLTEARAGYLDKLNVSGTLAHSDDAGTYKAAGFSTHSAGDVKTAIEAEGSHLALIKAKTDSLPSGVKKGVALENFPFLMVSSEDHVTPMPELEVTGQICKDNGTWASLTNDIVVIGSGAYRVSFTETEMNADVISLKFTADGADQRMITIVTSS